MTKHSGQSDHFVDYYQLLGVTKSADVTTIKRAYRSQIARHHPDRADGKPDDEMASLLNAAYATLKDDESRQVYDNKLMEHHQKLWLADKKRQLTEKIERLSRGCRPNFTISWVCKQVAWLDTPSSTPSSCGTSWHKHNRWTYPMICRFVPSA